MSLRPTNDASFAFINLARRGKITWITWVMMILMVNALTIGNISSVLFDKFEQIYPSLYRLSSVEYIFALAVNLIASWFCLRFSIERVERRPIHTLISIDGTFKPRLILLGMTIWVCAQSFSWILFSVCLRVAFGCWPINFGRINWNPGLSTILSELVVTSLISFTSIIEEMFFRGWLTQKFGQYIKYRLATVIIVAIFFSAGHGKGDWLHYLPFFLLSIGLSILTLYEGRLEIAMGAHIANNIGVIWYEIILINAKPDPKILFPNTDVKIAISVFLTYSIMLFILIMRRKRSARVRQFIV